MKTPKFDLAKLGKILFSPLKFIFQFIYKTLVNLISLFNLVNSINKVKYLKQDLKSKQDSSSLGGNNNDSNISNNILEDKFTKEQWLNYSQSMKKRSKIAMLYIVLVSLWFISCLMLPSSNIPFWVGILQAYFIVALLYYFIMCRYRSYEGFNKAHGLPALTFDIWFKEKFRWFN